MFRTIFLTVLAAVIAIVGGAGSVWLALEAPEGVGAVTVGAWTAYPALGSPEADPYSRARVAREGILTLGRGEGLTFAATHDSAGAALLRECAYMVEGAMPPARLWTFYAADRRMTALPPPPAGIGWTHSQKVLRLPDNSVAIAAAPHASPGNWVATSGRGGMTLVLTVYDTPIAGSAGLGDLTLPRITKGRCDA